MQRRQGRPQTEATQRQRVVLHLRRSGRLAFRPFPMIAERTMRHDGVVVTLPSFDQHLGLTQQVEELPVQPLVPELAIEGFVVAVFPPQSRARRRRCAFQAIARTCSGSAWLRARNARPTRAARALTSSPRPHHLADDMHALGEAGADCLGKITIRCRARFHAVRLIRLRKGSADPRRGPEIPNVPGRRPRPAQSRCRNHHRIIRHGRSGDALGQKTRPSKSRVNWSP